MPLDCQIVTDVTEEHAGSIHGVSHFAGLPIGLQDPVDGGGMLLITIYQLAWHNASEDLNLHHYCCENLASCMVFT
jgi:hypothetical protein